MPADPSIADRLARHGQEHLVRWWDELDPAARDHLAAEVEAIDLSQVDGLFHQLLQEDEAPTPDRVAPVLVDRLPRTDGERVARRHVAAIGDSALAGGEVAVVIVAGGSGTRLGFEGPKGTYPIAPVSAASLFQIHSEKIVALSKRHGKTVPLYVMTSPENHDQTTQFFEENGNFGLNHVRFFVQGQMPAVDRESGKILLAAKDRVALSPDGHGGTLYALAASGPDGGPSCLAEMRDRGIRTIFYFQVDNPMVKIADPAFLGLHRQAEAELSFKVIEKVAPDEKLGVVVLVDGRPQVIEYSDLPAELAELRDPDGGLRLWAGSIAIHVLERSFVERLVGGDVKLPFHRAIKKVRITSTPMATVIQARSPQRRQVRAVHLRRPTAGHSKFALVETDRAVEFEPLKNATGPDSPATVRQTDERPVRRLARSRRSQGRAPSATAPSPSESRSAHSTRWMRRS